MGLDTWPMRRTAAAAAVAAVAGATLLSRATNLTGAQARARRFLLTIDC